jgi:DNA-damage-inducible protein J
MTTNIKEKKENKSNLIQVRLDNQTKIELEYILNLLGLTTSQAVLMYIKQIVLKKKIPFELSVLNDYDDSEISQDEFRKMQAKIVQKLDKDEEIPTFHENNLKEFKFKKK